MTDNKRVRVKCIGCGKKFWPRSRTGWKKKIVEHKCPYCYARTPDWVHREMVARGFYETKKKEI